MQYILSTLKSAILAAANASNKPGFEDIVASTCEFNKAVHAKWIDDKNDARNCGYWLELATYLWCR